MSVTVRAVQAMLTELAIPHATASDLKVQPPSGRASGVRVQAAQLDYDRVWYPAYRMWVSDSPEQLGSSVQPSGVQASATAYTLGAAIIADLWGAAAQRELNASPETRSYFEACARSCEIFLTTSLAQSISGPYAGETLAYAREVVSGRGTSLAPQPPSRQPSELVPRFAAGSEQLSGQQVVYVPVPVQRRGIHPAAIVALTVVGVVGLGAIAAAVTWMATVTSVQAETTPIAGAEGVPLDATIVVNDGEAWECHDEYDCWSWNVTPAEDCDRADFVFGFASTVDGTTEQTETRRLYQLYAGDTREVTLNLEHQPYEYAGINEIRCLD